MPDYLVTVVIPTLAADSRLLECVQSLSRQTRPDLEVLIVDNSGKGLVARNGTAPGARVIENAANAGFGAAVNQGIRASSSPYVATLNDDAVAHPDWLANLLAALIARPDVGMCASQVRLFGEPRLDSAGMLVARDGSSKQRGHGRLPEDFPVLEEVLMPSGSAALFRRDMLDDIGGFDDEFFLYCEDTDLGLRARWAGWKCLYVPQAVVEHHYSHSAGRASPVKAYYVERNRLFVLVKNFPGPALLAAPLVSAARYLWHAWYILKGQGSAARFRAEGNASPKMLWYVLRAHTALLANLPRLLRQRRRIRNRARITPTVFRHLLRSHAISAPEDGRPVIAPDKPDSLLVIVPALNEEGAIGNVVREIQQYVPGVPIVVIDDCSRDNTIHLARQAGARVLPMPHHLGLGGCVQAGYKLAYELGYQYVIRVDGDGQHNAADIPRVFHTLKTSGCEMVIGSRFVSENGQRTGVVRSLGIRFFRFVLRPVLGKAVHDPTSGFVGVNRNALNVFRGSFPLEYPEIEALVVLQRRRFKFEEVPCQFRPARTTGRSTITAVKSLYYVLHVLLGVFVNVLKFDRRYHRLQREHTPPHLNQSRDREGVVTPLPTPSSNKPFPGKQGG